MSSLKFPTLAELSPRGIRVLELVLVIGVAFLGAGIGSLQVVFTDRLPSPTPGSADWHAAALLLHFLVGLALLAYVAHRQGRGATHLNPAIAGRDIPWSLVLFILGFVAAVLCYLLIGGWVAAHTGRSLRGINALWSAKRAADSLDGIRPLADVTLSVLVVARVVVNPFFEELIVRAYAMTEVLGLTGSGALAVLVSVGVQTLYHLYQGVPMALAHGATFSVFSLYYLRTRRIAPVVLAHLYGDVGALTLSLLRTGI